MHMRYTSEERCSQCPLKRHFTNGCSLHSTNPEFYNQVAQWLGVSARLPFRLQERLGTMFALEAVSSMCCRCCKYVRASLNTLQVVVVAT